MEAKVHRAQVPKSWSSHTLTLTLIMRLMVVISWS